MLFPSSELLEIAPGAVLLCGAATQIAEDLYNEIGAIVATSPLRVVMTPMGKPMSVEMTNCGVVGWVADRSGYRYDDIDPVTAQGWPSMPHLFLEAATKFATQAGYPYFSPDVCLINKYSLGSKMGMHQDRDEQDFTHPIVSISMGLPIRFRFGGLSRSDRATSMQLCHGDVVVFGGASRLAFHGVGTLRSGQHYLTGRNRFNLTFRCSGARTAVVASTNEE